MGLENLRLCRLPGDVDVICRTHLERQGQSRGRPYVELCKITITLILLVEIFPKSSVQSLSHVRLFATPWTAARQASLSITNPQSLLKLLSIESMMPSNHLILCHPLLLRPSISTKLKFSGLGRKIKGDYTWQCAYLC